jgi:trk system potassium uptake protein TrkA
MVLNFDGTDVEKLEEEGLKNADVLVAVTGNSETNVLTCLVAKDRGVKKTIAMVENIEYLSLTQSIGIDSLINKKLAAANFIYRYIRRGDFVTLSTIHGIDSEVMEFNVTSKCKVTQKAIKDLDLPKNAIIGGVIRDGKGLIPTGDFEIQPLDKVVVFAKTECARKVARYFR